MVGITSLILICPFLIPIAKAQEWTLDGADTPIIPGFSVYPSEEYVYNVSVVGMLNDMGFIFEIEKGNITDPGTGNGTGVWGDFWTLNTTSGEKTINMADALFAFWNETLFISQSFPCIIPVENDGKVSLSILNNVTYYFDTMIASQLWIFEQQQTFHNIYSIAYWNTSNNAYMKMNYTDEGIMAKWETYLVPNVANVTLYSQPAQQTPVFSFTGEGDILTFNSTDFKIETTITDADNNNDGVTDTDYLFRILNGSTWTSWAAPTSLLDWDLGSVAAGNYTVTMEVKNMYGVTQEEIIIEYIPPAVNGDELISGYPIFLVSMVAILGIIIITYRHRKKLKI